MNPAKWRHLMYINLTGDFESVLDTQSYNGKGKQTLRCILSAPKNTSDWMHPRMHDGSHIDETSDTILSAICGVCKHHESLNFKHEYINILNVNEQQDLNVQKTLIKQISNFSAESKLSSRCLKGFKPRSHFIAMPEK